MNLLDAPHTIVNAIKTATVFLSWQENLEKEYVPPKRIWLDGEKIDEHFKRVEKLREEKLKTGSTSVEGWDGDMKENAAAKALVVD